MAEKTLLDLYRNDLQRPRDDHYRHVTLTGTRSFSTAEFFAATAGLAEALSELGVCRGDRVLLLSDNRPEWHQVDLAVLSLGAADVPVYPTLASAAVGYHAQHSGAKVAVSEDPRQTRKLLAVRDECPGLKVIIQIEGECPPGVLDYADVIGTYRSPEVEQRFWTRAATVASADLASIVYTSGTTGPPKGVMLSHRNFCANVEAVLPRVPLSAADEALEFLPLCHVFERTCGYAYMQLGVTRTYCAPGVVADHIRHIAPTIFASVPRLFEKIQSKITATVAAAPASRRKLFYWALGVGRRAAERRLEGQRLPPGLALSHRVADALVLKKIRAAFGGRLKAALSGGAPLSPELNWFFHAVGIPVQEGYGLTETSPGIGVAGFQPGQNRIGAVGKPLANVEIKLAEDGELLVRGPSVFSGYWQDPAATAEVFDAAGFFTTGDIARVDADGFLFITDRKKDLIIPAGGKNVAPQPIENELKAWPFIDNAVLVGDRMPYITALISPSEEELQVWAASKGLGGMDLQALLREKHVKRSFKEAVAAVNAGLGHFEQIKRYRVLPKPLSLEDGYLTPTLKVKRRQVEQDFAPLIEEMYGSS